MTSWMGRPVLPELISRPVPLITPAARSTAQHSTAKRLKSDEGRGEAWLGPPGVTRCSHDPFCWPRLHSACAPTIRCNPGLRLPHKRTRILNKKTQQRCFTPLACCECVVQAKRVSDRKHLQQSSRRGQPGGCGVAGQRQHQTASRRSSTPHHTTARCSAPHHTCCPTARSLEVRSGGGTAHHSVTQRTFCPTSRSLDVPSGSGTRGPSCRPHVGWQRACQSTKNSQKFDRARDP